MVTVLIFLLAFFALIGIVVYSLRNIVPITQSLFIVCYLLLFFFFLIGLAVNQRHYTESIDLFDDGYAFIAGEHLLTYFVYFGLYHIALVLLWVRKAALPPLVLAIGLCVVYIGCFFNGALILQLAGAQEEGKQWALFPLVSLFLGLAIIIRTLKSVNSDFPFRKSTLFFASIVAVLPVFVLITLLLMLFGQDYDSVSKALTETTTWGFSQHDHPPHLDHQGHYLCTVAACGSPQLVKPLRWGTRGKQRILVNRQLQIANAFEELISDLSPKLHHFIRKNYDRYGYDLSKKIKSRWASNLTYLLMKPLEWVFLLCLYSCCLHPEEKIKRQYALKPIADSHQLLPNQ